MTIATLFVLLNPAFVAAIWLAYEKTTARRAEVRLIGVASSIGAAALVIGALAGGPALDALDISDSTFMIAAGVLVIFGAFQGFLGVSTGYRLNEPIWLTVALLIWLASPAPIAAAIAIRLDSGIGTAVAASVIGVVMAVTLGFLGALLLRDRRALVLEWIRLILAALAALGGVDFIRQGVLSI